jgi:hypothetical protein
MTASVRRRTSFSRTLLALAGVALLALLALTAVLLGSALTEHSQTVGVDSHGTAVSAVGAVGEQGHVVPSAHAIHQQPSTRARGVAFAVLAAAVVVGAGAFRRLRFARTGRPRTLRIAGLPPGRAPPIPRIA